MTESPSDTDNSKPLEIDYDSLPGWVQQKLNDPTSPYKVFDIDGQFGTLKSAQTKRNKAAKFGVRIVSISAASGIACSFLIWDSWLLAVLILVVAGIAIGSLFKIIYNNGVVLDMIQANLTSSASAKKIAPEPDDPDLSSAPAPEDTHVAKSETVGRLPAGFDPDEPERLALFADLPLDALVPAFIHDNDMKDLDVAHRYFYDTLQFVAEDSTAAVACLQKLLQHPSIATRDKLFAWRTLRELGEMPEAIDANDLQGIVAETTGDQGYHVIACFADGMVETIQREQIIESAPAAIRRKSIVELLKAAQPLFRKCKAKTSHPVPTIGKMMFTFLSYGGNRGALVDQEKLNSQDHPMSKIYQWMQKLESDHKSTHKAY